MQPIRVLLAAALLSTPASAEVWAGANAATNGFGVHAGFSLLRVPIIGAVGVEGAAEKGWGSVANRYAAGVTVRDLNLPLTRVDAFATVGGEYQGRFGLYGEAGLRGPLVGPAGWRGFVRASTAGRLGAGVGIELRF